MTQQSHNGSPPDRHAICVMVASDVQARGQVLPGIDHDPLLISYQHALDCAVHLRAALEQRRLAQS